MPGIRDAEAVLLHFRCVPNVVDVPEMDGVMRVGTHHVPRHFARLIGPGAPIPGHTDAHLTVRIRRSADQRVVAEGVDPTMPASLVIDEPVLGTQSVSDVLGQNHWTIAACKSAASG